jgi:cytochrome P450
MLAELVEARQAAPADDLVSGLISACDGDERLSTQELLSTIFELIAAGHDTTTSLPGNSVVALLRNPAQLAQLRSETAIEEFLRYDAPVSHSTFRYAIEPGQIGDSHRGLKSSSAWPPPTGTLTGYAPPVVLNIDRAGTRHLALGRSLHHCLGAPLPRMEGQFAPGSLLHRFPELRLAVPATELHWGHGDGPCCAACPSCPSFPARTQSARLLTGGRGGGQETSTPVRRSPGSPQPRARSPSPPKR